MPLACSIFQTCSLLSFPVWCVFSRGRAGWRVPVWKLLLPGLAPGAAPTWTSRGRSGARTPMDVGAEGPAGQPGTQHPSPVWLPLFSLHVEDRGSPRPLCSRNEHGATTATQACNSTSRMFPLQRAVEVGADTVNLTDMTGLKRQDLTNWRRRWWEVRYSLRLATSSEE